MKAQIEANTAGAKVSGSMTMDNAAGLLAQGVAALGEGKTCFDLSAVADIDSSGLAVLFGWQRAASAQGKTISITNPPRNLRSLADVYGVSDLLPLS
jgi:phospholipid transport system transporter-binding protein